MLDHLDICYNQNQIRRRKQSIDVRRKTFRSVNSSMPLLDRWTRIILILGLKIEKQGNQNARGSDINNICSHTYFIGALSLLLVSLGKGSYLG